MSERHRWGRRTIGVALAMLVIVAYVTACLGTDSVSVTPTPTKTPRPEGTLPAVPTATHTPTIVPTSDERPTAVPTPVQTQIGEPTPTDVSTPTPTEVPVVGGATITPWPTLAADVCPLTGLQVSDPALLERRPLAVKIQNAAISRPQFGLPQADIVYEHLTEAAITRFTGIYLCQEVDKIGSTRSARFIDLELPAMYKSLLAFSGTSAGLYPKFLNADFYDREFCYGWGLHASGFYRDIELREAGIPIEHTLFADPAKIWAIADDLGINDRQDLQGMDFDTEVPEGGLPATHVRIPYPSSDMRVDYYYDAETGAYLRWNAGDPHLDSATGQQIQVTNVVVVYATHVDTLIYEDEPRRNHPSVQIQLWGTGSMVLFRDGQAYQGLWARPQRDDMLLLRDAAGQFPIPLKPGNTWVQLVPLPGHRWAFEASWDTEGQP
jgi:hypothetical protein